MMKGGIRPVDNPANQTMPEWIDMHVIKVSRVIFFVANEMLPIAPLPDAALMAGKLRVTTSLAGRECAGKGFFDLLPAPWKIIVPGRQGPETMQVLRQHNPSVDMKRPFLPRQAHCLSQHVDMPQQQIALPVKQIHGKKVRPACDTITKVFGHDTHPRLVGDAAIILQRALACFA